MAKKMSPPKLDDDEEYSDERVDYVCNQPSDLEDPVCRRCGSTKWTYCTLGENNRIRKCSDCPRRSNLH